MFKNVFYKTTWLYICCILYTPDITHNTTTLTHGVEQDTQIKFIKYNTHMHTYNITQHRHTTYIQYNTYNKQ